MKTLGALIVIICLAAGSLHAQKIKESEVPAPVKESLKSQYPNVKVQKWEHENGNYEAEFDLAKIETSVLLDHAGSILETETAISVKELPAPIVAYMNKNAGGKKIKDAARIIDAAGVTTYEAEAGGEDYLFDTNGTLIKKEIDNDKD